MKQKFIHLTITTAAQNEVALSYRSLRGLYFMAVCEKHSLHHYRDLNHS